MFRARTNAVRAILKRKTGVMVEIDVK